MMAPVWFALGYRADTRVAVKLRSPLGLAAFAAGKSLALQANTTHHLSRRWTIHAGCVHHEVGHAVRFEPVAQHGRPWRLDA
jgi:hypothetical protein